jgi:hypothetical protein
MPIDGLKWGESPGAMTPGAAGANRQFAACPASGCSRRSEYVEQVRQAVVSGAYRVDSLQVADRLIERGVLDRSFS